MKIKVCVGTACHLKGSYNIIAALQELLDKNETCKEVEISAAFCLGHCGHSVSVQIDEENVESVDSQNVTDFFNKNVLSKFV